jgi:hypothetical protein
VSDEFSPAWQSYRRRGEPGYIGLGSETSDAEVAVTSAAWAAERYGLTLGSGPRLEMYVYVPDLDDIVRRLAQAGVSVLREPEDMPWGERIATVTDPEAIRSRCVRDEARLLWLGHLKAGVLRGRRRLVGRRDRVDRDPAFLLVGFDELDQAVRVVRRVRLRFQGAAALRCAVATLTWTGAVTMPAPALEAKTRPAIRAPATANHARQSPPPIASWTPTVGEPSGEVDPS